MTLSSKLTRRNPVDRWHASAGAEFGDAVGATAPLRYPEKADANRCAIADLSAMPRIGFKGWNVWTKLGELGLTIPAINNVASAQPDGRLCLRLGDNEALLLSGLAGIPLNQRETAVYQTSDGFYPVPRSETHAWFLLTGEAIPSLLAKLSAVDFRLHKFGFLAIAQTSAAGVSVVIARADLNQLPAFHLLVDRTTAQYLWDELLHAAQEYNGRPIGTETLCQAGIGGRARGPASDVVDAWL